MLTGKIRNDIDKLWEKIWTGGITNPLTVIEQISCLMFAHIFDMQAKSPAVTDEVCLMYGHQTGIVGLMEKMIPTGAENQRNLICGQ